MDTKPIYKAGPFPYMPGYRIFRKFLKVQAQYETAGPVGKVRLFKKAESLMKKFKKETGFEIPIR